PAPFAPPYRILFDWVSTTNASPPQSNKQIVYNETNPNFYKVDVPNSTEYFILERREKSNFDRYTWAYESQGPPSGILIWRAAINQTGANSDFVHLIPADNNSYPSTTNRFPEYISTPQNLNDLTTPSSNLHNGDYSNISFNNIEWIGHPLHGVTEVDIELNAIKIDQNTLWDEDITLSKQVFIESGATLEIDAGVDITISSAVQSDQIKFFIKDGGKLLLSGTDINPVSITSYSYWGGILVYGTGEVETHYAQITNTKKVFGTESESATFGLYNSNFENSEAEAKLYGNVTILNSTFINALLHIDKCLLGSQVVNSVFSSTANLIFGVRVQYPLESFLNIRNCTFNNFETALQIGSIENKALPSNPKVINVIIKNNIISNCTNSIDIDEGSIDIDYNNFYNNNSDQNKGVNWISVDPKYVNTTANDYHLLWDSDCIDAGDPNSAFSNELEPNGGRINLGAYGNTQEATTTAYTGGLITQNTTWNGDTYVIGDVTVGSSVILTIAPGVTVHFISANSPKIIVNGSLLAQGTSSSPITFTSADPTPTINDWKGIEVNGSGSSVTIEHCIIEYAYAGVKFTSGAIGTVSNSTISDNYYGIYTYSANPIITNCNINNNKYGIRIYNSYTSPTWSTVHLSGNSITNSAYYGLYCYTSSPTLLNNTFSGNKNTLWTNTNPILEGNSFINSSSYGLACYGSASPNLNYNSTYSFGGYNTITGNSDDGVRITSSSNPNFGNPSSSLGGYNVILDNTNYEIENTGSKYVQACWNWWGDENGLGSSTVYGSVRWMPWLEYDPNPQQKSSFGLPVYAYDKDSDLPEDLQLANFEQNTAEYKTSADKFKKHFTENKESKHNSLASIQYIKSLSYCLAPKAIVDELEKTLAEKQSVTVQYELLSGLAGQLPLINEGQKAISKLDEALKLKVEQANKDRLLSQKGMIYVYTLNEAEKGKSIFESILKSSSKESPWYELAQAELEILNGSKSILPKQAVESDYAIIPDEFKLIGNYPNPFNPSTTIGFYLSEASQIKLIIYNLLGQKVETLIDRYLSSGEHQVSWEASPYASGTYYYILSSPTDFKVKKMVYLK
ncbi:MAG: right-handed parallel beta-helix repeat-containing protein, partial [Bacteroidota bacterium]